MLCECARHDCGLDVPRAQLVGDTPECPKARLLRRVDTLGCPRVVRVLSVLSARLFAPRGHSGVSPMLFWAQIRPELPYEPMMLEGWRRPPYPPLPPLPFVSFCAVPSARAISPL